MEVIPLSVSNVLVQRTDTLHSVVELYPKLYLKDLMEELKKHELYATEKYDNFIPLQKLKINEKIFSEVS
jgi:hypothetical protein